MPKKEEDILQIRKYLNGELDAKAMHRLERRAQDDPFLMDALEGYQNTADDQAGNLSALNTQLQQRLSRRERKIIPWKYIAVAASVLIVIGVGALLLINKQVIKTPVAANISAPVVKPVTVIKSPDAPLPDSTPVASPNKSNVSIVRLQPKAPKTYLSKTAAVVSDAAISAPVLNESLASTNPAMADNVVAKDTTPLNELIVMDYTAQKKKETSVPITKKVAQTGKPVLLQARVEGVSVTSPERRQNIPTEISGLVTGRDDGLPIAGAQVHIAGSDKAAFTNSQGRFKLPVDSNKASLSVGYIGYKSQLVDINQKDSLKISLEPATNSLNEVVVAQHAIPVTAGNDANTTTAHPRTGWGSFNKYMEKNAVSPDGNTGEVELTVLVNSYGEISRVKVIKGLSGATDKKAVSLITLGPRWTGNSNGKSEAVRVKINFRKR